MLEAFAYQYIKIAIVIGIMCGTFLTLYDRLIYVMFRKRGK